jgi:hypothetical protein
MAGFGKLKCNTPLFWSSSSSSFQLKNQTLHTKQVQTPSYRIANMVQVGDSIPSIPLKEGKPDVEVDLSKELGDGIIIGVPAAFSMLSFPVLACS